MMTTRETVESARDINMGDIINQLDPDSKKIARRLEKILIQKMKKEYSVLFNNTCLDIYICSVLIKIEKTQV